MALLQTLAAHRRSSLLPVIARWLHQEIRPNLAQPVLQDAYFTARTTLRVAGQQDYNYYHAMRWSDRDPVMRYRGNGIGHKMLLTKPYVAQNNANEANVGNTEHMMDLDDLEGDGTLQAMLVVEEEEDEDVEDGDEYELWDPIITDEEEEEVDEYVGGYPEWVWRLGEDEGEEDDEDVDDDGWEEEDDWDWGPKYEEEEDWQETEDVTDEFDDTRARGRGKKWRRN